MIYFAETFNNSDYPFDERHHATKFTAVNDKEALERAIKIADDIDH